MELLSLATSSREVLPGLYRKLGGISSYDGLPEFIAETYRALELGQPQPIGLDEIEEIVSLVDRLATLEFKI